MIIFEHEISISAYEKGLKLFALKNFQLSRSALNLKYFIGFLDYAGFVSPIDS